MSNTPHIVERLKACPFCGSAAIIELIRARNWMARCGRACDVNKYGKTKLTTIAAWNLRTPDPVITAYEAALTPSAETKAAYIGEFSFTVVDRDEDGDEVYRKVLVPWTTTKEIMAAIRERSSKGTQP